MEVSSHALSLGRVAGCEFDTAAFTNLTEDHLDYHKTMENYAEAKAKLFAMVSSKGQTKGNKSAWLNGDDSWANVMDKAVSDRVLCPVRTFGMEKHADLLAFDSTFSGKSSDFKVKYKGKSYDVTTRLAGRFNIYNTLCAIGACLSEGMKMEDIVKAISEFQSVPDGSN